MTDWQAVEPNGDGGLDHKTNPRKAPLVFYFWKKRRYPAPCSSSDLCLANCTSLTAGLPLGAGSLPFSAKCQITRCRLLLLQNIGNPICKVVILKTFLWSVTTYFNQFIDLFKVLVTTLGQQYWRQAWQVLLPPKQSVYEGDRCRQSASLRVAFSSFVFHRIRKSG